PVSRNRKTTAPSRACGLTLKGVDVRQRADARAPIRQSDRSRLHRISTSSPGAAQQGGDGPWPEWKIPNEINGDRLGTVFAALQHTGPTGAVRAVRRHARGSKKKPKATPCLAISTPSKSVTSKASSPACRSPRPRARAPALPPVRERKRRSRAGP